MTDKKKNSNKQKPITKKPPVSMEEFLVNYIPGYDPQYNIDGPLADIYGCAAALSMMADGAQDIMTEASLNSISDVLMGAHGKLQRRLFMARSEQDGSY